MGPLPPTCAVGCGGATEELPSEEGGGGAVSFSMCDIKNLIATLPKRNKGKNFHLISEMRLRTILRQVSI